MYNQFTAIDQKPLPMGKIQLNPMQLPKAGKKKKKKIRLLRILAHKLLQKVK